MGPLYGVLVAAGVAGIALLPAWRRRRAQNARAAELQAGLTQLAELSRHVRMGDWQASLQAVLAALIDGGYGRSAGLYTLGEDEPREPRVWVGGAAAPPGACPEAALRALRADRCPHWTDADGRLYLPIKDGSELIGVLAVAAPRRDPGVSLAVWEGAAGLMAVLITGLRFFDRVHLISNTDGLTGLYNHRHFHQLLGVHLAQAYLRNEPVCLVLLDIDWFKGVNDTYGHLFGDMVLRELAALLRGMLPPGAAAARYGGEELAFVLPGLEISAAREVAERVRAAVADHTVSEPCSGDAVQVTVSVGVAQYQLGAGKSRFIAAADEAMYASKRGGRNRVTCAEPVSCA